MKSDIFSETSPVNVDGYHFHRPGHDLAIEYSKEERYSSHKRIDERNCMVSCLSRETFAVLSSSWNQWKSWRTIASQQEDIDCILCELRKKQNRWSAIEPIDCSLWEETTERSKGEPSITIPANINFWDRYRNLPEPAISYGGARWDHNLHVMSLKHAQKKWTDTRAHTFSIAFWLAMEISNRDASFIFLSTVKIDCGNFWLMMCRFAASFVGFLSHLSMTGRFNIRVRWYFLI